MAIKVGTFQKSVAAAPAVQPLVGFGFKPKALILWTAAQTALATWADNAIFAIGMTDGTRQRSGCSAIQHNVGTTNTARGWADAALTIYDYDSTLLAEAAITSFDAGGFTLTWTTNNASAYYIHYLAVGGDDLTDVYLKDWTLTSGAGGNQAVAGIGFQPDLVIHLGSQQTLGSSAWAMLQFGAMTASDQFGMGTNSADGDAASSGRSATDDAWVICLPSAGVFPFLNTYVTYVSMDADGFTVNKNDAPDWDSPMASLCFKGGNYKVGDFNEEDLPGVQSVTLVGFRPEGVLVAGGNSQWSNLTPEDNAKICLGAADGTNQAGAAFCDIRTADPTDAQATARTNAWIVRGGNATSDQDLAAFTSLDADGFTHTWSVTTNTLADYGYIAFDTGPETPPVPPGPTGTFHDILFVTRSVGYVSVEDASGNPEIWRTIDGGYSWHILPDKGGLLDSDITGLTKLAACQKNRIMTVGQTSDAGVLVEFTGD